jgi:hypothetical protein
MNMAEEVDNDADVAWWGRRHNVRGGVAISGRRLWVRAGEAKPQPDHRHNLVVPYHHEFGDVITCHNYSDELTEADQPPKHAGSDYCEADQPPKHAGSDHA